MVSPQPRHGRTFSTRYVDESGQHGTFTFRFNGYEFSNPPVQGVFEANVLCARHNTQIRGIVITPAIS